VAERLLDLGQRYPRAQLVHGGAVAESSPVAGRGRPAQRRLRPMTASSNEGSGLIRGLSSAAAWAAVRTSSGASLVISALPESTSQTSSPISRPRSS
jgi:hypothetical protein